jgi:hypothetical protein
MTTAAALALERPSRDLRQEHRFFSGAATVMLAVTAIGFAPSFYLRGVVPAVHPYEPLIPRVLFHGLLFSAFLLLFVTQVWLVGFGRTNLHRKLGRVAYGLVPVMIVVAIWTGLGGVSRPLTAAPNVAPLSWLAVPLLDVPVFGTLLTLGILQRTRPVVHKRYMYLAMTDMMIPSLGRLPLPLPPSALIPVGQVVLPALFLVALALWDIRSMGRPHRITLAGGAAIIVVSAIKPLIWATPAWLLFARWVSAPFG